MNKLKKERRTWARTTRPYHLTSKKDDAKFKIRTIDDLFEVTPAIEQTRIGSHLLKENKYKKYMTIDQLVDNLNDMINNKTE